MQIIFPLRCFIASVLNGLSFFRFVIKQCLRRAEAAYYRCSFMFEIAGFAALVEDNLAAYSVTRLEIDACNAKQLFQIIGTVVRELFDCVSFSDSRSFRWITFYTIKNKKKKHEEEF